MLLASRSRSLPTALRGGAVVAVLASATALAGCTSQTAATKQTKTLSGAAADVQNVIQDMSTRAANTDAAGICRNDLDASAQAAFAQAAGTCQKGVLKAIDTADALSMDVTSVKVNGATAVAQIDTPDDIGTRSVTLTKPGAGKWKIVSFGAALTKKGAKSTTPAGTTPASTSTTP